MPTLFSAKSIHVTDNVATIGADQIIHLTQIYQVQMLANPPGPCYSAADVLFATAASGDVVTLPTPFSTLSIVDPNTTNSTVKASVFAAGQFTVSKVGPVREGDSPEMWNVPVESMALSPLVGGGKVIDPTPGGSENTIFVWNGHIDSVSEQSQRPLFKDYTPADVIAPYASGSGPQVMTIFDGEPVSPPVLEDIYDELFSISFMRNTAAPRNDPTDSTPFPSRMNYYDIMYAARGKTNNDTVDFIFSDFTRSFARNTLKVADARASTDRFTGAITCLITFKYHAAGWNVPIQPQSTHHLGTGAESGQLVFNKNSVTQTQITSPQFLQSNGTDFVHTGQTVPPPMVFRNAAEYMFDELVYGLESVLWT